MKNKLRQVRMKLLVQISSRLVLCHINENNAFLAIQGRLPNTVLSGTDRKLARQWARKARLSQGSGLQKEPNSVAGVGGYFLRPGLATCTPKQRQLSFDRPKLQPVPGNSKFDP